MVRVPAGMCSRWKEPELSVRADRDVPVIATVASGTGRPPVPRTLPRNDAVPGGPAATADVSLYGFTRAPLSR